MNKKIYGIIVSDLHMGSTMFNRDDFLRFIRQIKLRRVKLLILAGDIFELWYSNLDSITRTDFVILNEFLAIAKNGTKIIFIPGNHDSQMIKLAYRKRKLKKWFGTENIKVMSKYQLNTAKGRFLVVHGHEFEFSSNSFLSKFFFYILPDIFYVSLVNLNKITHPLFNVKISLLVRGGMINNRVLRRIKATAKKHAQKREFSGIIMSHCHWPERVVYRDGFVYYNSGDWVEHNTYLAIDNKGEITVCHFT